MPLTRRQFLTGAAALGSATAMGACSSVGDTGDAIRKGSPTTSAPTTTSTSPGASGTLVLVTLYGGNDALNTVVPVGDPAYISLRGSLALDPADTHDIGDGFALHPSLPRLAAQWAKNRAAIVHGVGFAGLDRSHFHCMDVWQAGSEDDHTTGWLGRWLDLTGSDPLDAVVLGRSLPLLARGARRSASVVSPGPFVLPGDRALRDLVAMMVGGGGRPPLLGAVATSTADLLAVVDRVAPVVAKTTAGDDLASQLDTVATMIEAGLPTRVYNVALGGFDTHADQADTHAGLLAELDTALGDFLDRVDDVTVAAFSEFGRRVAPNASGGTDHGSGGTVLLAGNIRPGHHGEPPPLDQLDEGDLATTTDFRAVLGGLLGGVLGTDPDDVFDGGVKPLTLV
ncbi:MAG: DUF1501 domain-containing protein [Aquihabitans sp.]